MDDRLLTRKEAAELLGLSVAVVKKWTLRGYLPVICLGRIRRYSYNGLTKWMAKKIAENEAREEGK